jgi:hypothetical protein
LFGTSRGIQKNNRVATGFLIRNEALQQSFGSFIIPLRALFLLHHKNNNAIYAREQYRRSVTNTREIPRIVAYKQRFPFAQKLRVIVFKVVCWHFCAV